MTAILEVNHITGGYSMTRPVLHDVQFNIKSGELVGLLGLNGAGKSTTMKHILGLMHPHEGEVKILGKTLKADPTTYRQSLAYVPENPLMYEELTVLEHLRMTATAYGINEKEYNTRVGPLLSQFQMEANQNKFAQHLSKGMRQKVMIMCAFLIQPALYIIDEPFLGLDPIGIRSLLQQMVAAKQEGSSLLISSHILSTIEHYCDRFIILDHGKIIIDDKLEGLHKASHHRYDNLEEMFYYFVQGGGAEGR